MKKIYYLSTCYTCRDIIKRLGPLDDFEKQDIKTVPISARQLDEMKKLAGSYEALFSRRAIKYRTLNLKHQTLHEPDYRRLILEEYTFLKRPVIIVQDEIFIGSDEKTIQSVPLDE